MRRKIGELQTKTADFVIYYEKDRKANPYRIARKWYDRGWHTKTEERYDDFMSVMVWLTRFVMKEERIERMWIE